MNYSSFVKNFYRLVIENIKDFDNYFGTIVSTNTILNIDKDYKTEKVFNLSILPSYEIVISAPDTVFEQFLEYYGNLYPDLGNLFPDKDKLRSMYKLMLNQVQDEEKYYDYIKLIVDIVVEDLKREGVLVYGNQEQ